jgi:ribosomal protein L37AE/L43A
MNVTRYTVSPRLKRDALDYQPDAYGEWVRFADVERQLQDAQAWRELAQQMSRLLWPENSPVCSCCRARISNPNGNGDFMCKACGDKYAEPQAASQTATS